MTTELQRVMARYEEARIAYKKAVLASLNGDSSGEGIRQAIAEFRQASVDLRRITGAPAPTPRAPMAPRTPALQNRASLRKPVPSLKRGVPAWATRAVAAAGRVQLPSLGFALRRLLSAE